MTTTSELHTEARHWYVGQAVTYTMAVGPGFGSITHIDAPGVVVALEERWVYVRLFFMPPGKWERLRTNEPALRPA